MGKLTSGIYGPGSGKLGGTVLSSWKGINTVRTYRETIANPRTAGQIAQRDKMLNIVAFASIILSAVIKPLWDRFASKKSGYNAFCATNIALFAAPIPSVPANLVLSSGKMASTAISNLVLGGGNTTITASWLNDAGQGFKLATDKAYVVGMNLTTGEVAYTAAAQPRSNLSTVLTFATAGQSNEDFQVWLAFRRVDGTVVSDTGTDLVTVP